MKRSGKKRSPELIALQEAFWLEVVLAGDPEGPAQPCWFAENIPTSRKCDGRIEAAHWIKRQRVERYIAEQFGPVGVDVAPVHAAAWDPRNAVPACSRCHQRFDSQRMPPLVVWRHQVPALVEMFAEDWGLGVALADKSPSICSERTASDVRCTDLPINQGGTQ